MISEQTVRMVTPNMESFVESFIGYVTEPVGLQPFSDEELERWGNYFIANNLYARGVLFETFLQYPKAIAEALAFRRAMPLPDGVEFYPPLPRQLDAAERIESHNRPRRRAITGTMSNDLVFLRRQAD